jgi:hypothetical protein
VINIRKFIKKFFKILKFWKIYQLRWKFSMHRRRFSKDDHPIWQISKLGIFSLKIKNFWKIYLHRQKFSKHRWKFFEDAVQFGKIQMTVSDLNKWSKLFQAMPRVSGLNPAENFKLQY